MSENKKIRSKRGEEGPQNANKPAVSGESIQADSAPPRRNTRGKRGPKGKQGSSNASKNSHENEESQVLKLESDPKSQVSALKELFPEWTMDDLVFALEEAGHDLELTIAHITEGHASQWGQVKKKQPTKQIKLKSKSGDSDATAPKTVPRKSKKAPAARQDQPQQPSRKEKAAFQAKTLTAAESPKAQSVPGTDDATSSTPHSKPDHIPQQHIDPSNANTTHATQTEHPLTSTLATKTTPPQSDKPAIVADSSQSSKAPWAAIAKVKRKQAVPKVAPKLTQPSQPHQPTQLPSAASDAAVEEPLNPPVPLASKPTEPEVAPLQNNQKVEQREQEFPPISIAGSGSAVNKPVVDSIPAPATDTTTSSQSKPVDTKAPLGGFHGSTSGITTARLLSDKFPVVMPVANTGAIPEKVQVRFGSLTLGGDESLSNKPVAPPAGFASKQVKEHSMEAYASPNPQPPQFADSKPTLASNTEALPAKRQPQPAAPAAAPVADNSYYFDVKSNPSANTTVNAGAPQVSLPTGNTPTVSKQGNGGFMAMYSPVMHDIAPQQYGVGSSLPMSAASAYSNDPAMAGVHDKSNLPYTSRFGKPLENKVETNMSPFGNYQHAEYGAAPGFGPTAAHQHQHQQNAHAAYSGMSPLNYGQSVPNYFNERSQYSQYDPAVNGTPEMHGMTQNKVGSTAAAIPSLPNTTATPSPVVSQQPQPYAFPPMYPVPYMSYGYGSLPYGNNKYGQPQQGYVMQNGLNDFPPILGGHSSIYNRQQSGSVGSIGGAAAQAGNTATNAPVDKSRDMTGNNAMGSSLGGLSSMSGAARSAAPGMFVNEGEWGAPSPYGFVPQAGLNASPGGHQGTYPSNANKGGNVGNQGSGFPFNPAATTTSGTGGSGNGIGSYGAYNQTFMNRPGNWYGNA
ncbi:RNAPII degradation factor Def1 [Schizosaccharomyces osmophilus]|uniref:RNA polymerase II degradation factor 1 n=1 Tax=Schizosaccharomyces osmophilus TaxID=2545709 RepID=A0AAE9W8L8_9SCHI|nr:RNAPII degradation factor Def1 [Schizosaccharomyces osmophilus]WBW70842.1 RNAPII degradation factor Def1 [Schizosaccharomyces osmophilus]